MAAVSPGVAAGTSPLALTSSWAGSVHASIGRGRSLGLPGQERAEPRGLETKLQAAGLDLSTTEALQALRSLREVEIRLGEGRTKRSVTRGIARVTDAHGGVV